MGGHTSEAGNSYFFRRHPQCQGMSIVARKPLEPVLALRGNKAAYNYHPQCPSLLQLVPRQRPTQPTELVTRMQTMHGAAATRAVPPGPITAVHDTLPELRTARAALKRDLKQERGGAEMPLYGKAVTIFSSYIVTTSHCISLEPYM